MSERRIVATINPDPRDPKFTLAYVLSKKVPGTIIDRQPPHEDNFYQGTVSLIVEGGQEDNIKDTWNKIISTNDFLYLQKACEGDTAFFRETQITPDDLMISSDERGFMKFNRFLVRYAYYQALEHAQLQEDPEQVIQLRLEARKTWIPPLSALQRRLAPNYIQSVVERLHNLVTTSEEKKTFTDSVLDWIMG